MEKKTAKKIDLLDTMIPMSDKDLEVIRYILQMLKLNNRSHPIMFFSERGVYICCKVIPNRIREEISLLKDEEDGKTNIKYFTAWVKDYPKHLRGIKFVLEG